MSSDSIIVIADARRIGGLVETAKALGNVTALVVGNEELAQQAAATGCERVVLFETTDEVPPEAFSNDARVFIRDETPKCVLSNDDASARMLAASSLTDLDACVLSDVIGLREEGGKVIATCQLAEGIAVEDYVCEKPLIGIYAGDDSTPETAQPTEIERPQTAQSNIRIVETIEDEKGAVNLAEANRIVGVGRGLKKRDDLPLIEDLASALGAEIACTLPLCDDLHWYDASRVLGSSHRQAAPELYIAVGVQGAPNHMSGVRDAGTIVGINNDPDAGLFRRCKYGIVGDLYEIVPLLTEGLK